VLSESPRRMVDWRMVMIYNDFFESGGCLIWLAKKGIVSRAARVNKEVIRPEQQR